MDIFSNILHICALLMNACLHHCDCRIFSYIPCTEENQTPLVRTTAVWISHCWEMVYKKIKCITSQSCNLFPLLRTSTGRSTQRREHPKEGAPTRGNSFQMRKTWIHILNYYPTCSVPPLVWLLPPVRGDVSWWCTLLPLQPVAHQVTPLGSSHSLSLLLLSDQNRSDKRRWVMISSYNQVMPVPEDSAPPAPPGQEQSWGASPPPPLHSAPPTGQ